MMRRSLRLVPILVIAAILASAIPAAARDQIALGIANPAGNDPAVLDDHIQLVGKKPSNWALWSNWGSRGGDDRCLTGVGNCAFPTSMVKELHGRGIDAVIWWQPVNPANPMEGKYMRYQRIVNGHHDSYIRAWARAARDTAKASGRKIYIRFAHEAQGTWFPWSIGNRDNTVANFKGAWRRIDQLFRQVGARQHVRFIWSDLLPRKGTYPGPKAVDYVGLTILNWGSARTWTGMAKQVTPRVKKIRQFTSKPILLVETASHYRGGSKASWLTNGYNYVFKRHPIVKGIMYLDTAQPNLEQGHPDWRLIKPDDMSALNAYSKLAKLWKFRGRLK